MWATGFELRQFGSNGLLSFDCGLRKNNERHFDTTPQAHLPGGELDLYLLERGIEVAESTFQALHPIV